jgi:hypothetical protein
LKGSRNGFTGGYEDWEERVKKAAYLSTEHNIDLITAYRLLSELSGGNSVYPKHPTAPGILSFRCMTPKKAVSIRAQRKTESSKRNLSHFCFSPSCFGRQSMHKLSNEVTGYVMILPLLTKVDTETGNSNICFKSALESVFLKDLKQWKEDNLTENLTVKRRK